MSDANEWIKERRRIHDDATEGPWEVVPFNHDEWHEVKVVTRAQTKWDRYSDGQLPDVLGYDYEDYHSTVKPEDAAATVDAHNTLPSVLSALEKVLELHTRIVTDQHIDGPTAVCEQCSEDRMFALWPCETIEVIEGAIDG